jgi:hypothetical protein
LIFSRCQLLSCTTEKLGKKKNRKNRLRAFPTKWNELTKENREAIRRSLRNFFLLFFCFNKFQKILFLEIPSNVQRCCKRCYEKLIIQVRQRQTTTQEEDDDDDESSKIQSNITDEQNSKHNDGKKKIFVFFFNLLFFVFSMEKKRMDRK